MKRGGRKEGESEQKTREIQSLARRGGCADSFVIAC